MWGVNYGTAVNKLLLLQKRAVRIIDKKSYLSHSTPLFIKHKILKFPDIVQEQCIMIMLAHLNEGLPAPIASMFHYATPSNTRFTQHFQIPFASTNYGLFALSCSAPKIWNKTIGSRYKELEDVPRNKRNLKKIIRDHFFNNYSNSGT